MLKADAPPAGPPGLLSGKGAGGSTANVMTTPSKQRRGPPPSISTDVNDPLLTRPTSSSTSAAAPASGEGNANKSGGGGAEFRQAQTPKHCNKTGLGERGGRLSGGSGKKKDNNKQQQGKKDSKSPRQAPNLSEGGPPPLNGNHGPSQHLKEPFQQQQSGQYSNQGGPPPGPGGYLPYPQQRYPPPQYGNGPHYGPGGPPPPHQMHSPRSRGQAGPGGPGAPPPNTPPLPPQARGNGGGQQPYSWAGPNPVGPLPTVSPGSSSFRGGGGGGGGLPGSASWDQGSPPFYGAHTYHPHPPFQQHGGPPVPPFQGHLPPQAQQQRERDAGRFTRAVSSSFDHVKSKGSADSSTKEGNNKPASFSHDLHAYNHQHGGLVGHRLIDGKDGGAADDASVNTAATDHSWGMLHQVKSVDEAQLRAAELANAKDRSMRDETRTPVDQVQHGHPLAHPSSNASSLSHSPGHPKHANIHTSNNKNNNMTSLDSLSSVASIQEPIDTTGITCKDANKKGASAADDASWGAGAPDLMDCGTGSSGSLLFPSHHLRQHSFDHIGGREAAIGGTGKRGREERGDGETYNDTSGETDEIRKAASGGSPTNDKRDGGAEEERTKESSSSFRPTKKGRHRSVTEDTSGKDGVGDKAKLRQEQQHYKASPLSISCSPPGSPKKGVIQVPVVRGHKDEGKDNKGGAGGEGSLKPMHSFMASPGIPNYSFSIDSMPSFSKDGTARMMPYPQGLPPRPGSASSGSLHLNQRTTGGPSGPPGQTADKGGSNGHHPGEIPQAMPSWEIHGQDSFAGGMSVGSGGSAGGGVGGSGAPGLFSSFSFTTDYNMLAQSASQDQGQGPPPPQQQKEEGKGKPQSGEKQQPQIESRNQSFEQSNQQRQGGVTRSDTFDTEYSLPKGPGGGFQQQQGAMISPGGRQFPPHAPSWTSTGSAPGPHGSQSFHFAPPGGPPPPPGQYRGGPPPHHQHLGPHGMPMSRTFTEDSARTSSPPFGGMMHPSGPPMGPGQDGPPPGRHPGDLPAVPNAFRPPPPEFGAPQGNIGKRPPPTVYIMASAPGGGGPRGPMGGGGRPVPRSQQFDPSLMSKSGPPPNGVFNWTKDDDVRLSEIMKKYKNPRDWEPISREHGRGKGAKECHERWIRYLKPGVRKGQWTDHEDAIVVEAVTTSSEQPFTRWSDLAQRLPGRVGKQIRDRWVNHLNPNINHMPFSREDDLLLWNGHKEMGKRWVEISTKCFKSSRSENHIKNRWYSASFKKFISNEFGPDAYTGGKKNKDKAKDNNKGKTSSKGKGIKAE